MKTDACKVFRCADCWVDEDECSCACHPWVTLSLRLTVLGPRRRFRRRPVISVTVTEALERWDGHSITHKGVFKVHEERKDGTALVVERLGW